MTRTSLPSPLILAVACVASTVLVLAVPAGATAATGSPPGVPLRIDTPVALQAIRRHRERGGDLAAEGRIVTSAT